MRIVKGKRIHHLEPAEFAEWLARHPDATVDLGTGDGRFVRDLAVREPRCGAIGVDLCAAKLATASRVAPDNALFVVADAMAPPEELRGAAARVVVNFPWGSLLRGLLAGAAWWSAIARPGATVEVRLNAAALAEAGWDLMPGVDRVSATLHAAGFVVGGPVQLSPDDLRHLPTSWAKRLAFGRDPRGCLIAARMRGAACSAPASDEESAVPQKRFAVDRRFAGLTQVADHVPMDGRAVQAAGVGVAGAERHVDRAADLLVEEDVFGEARDAEIRAEGEFAEAARAGVGVERLNQKCFVFGRAGVDDLAGREPEPDVVDFAALRHDRK
jgi:16S rRNA (adenine(1408)-N(1))-methyltransferase